MDKLDLNCRVEEILTKFRKNVKHEKGEANTVLHVNQTPNKQEKKSPTKSDDKDDKKIQTKHDSQSNKTEKLETVARNEEKLTDDTRPAQIEKMEKALADKLSPKKNVKIFENTVDAQVVRTDGFAEKLAPIKDKPAENDVPVSKTVEKQQTESMIQSIQVITKTEQAPDKLPANTDFKSKIMQNQINNQQSRSTFYAKTNVKRFPVSEKKVSWEVNWPEYTPVQYTDNSVLKNTNSDMDIDLLK